MTDRLDIYDVWHVFLLGLEVDRTRGEFSNEVGNRESLEAARLIVRAFGRGEIERFEAVRSLSQLPHPTLGEGLLSSKERE